MWSFLAKCLVQNELSKMSVIFTAIIGNLFQALKC